MDLRALPHVCTMCQLVTVLLLQLLLACYLQVSEYAADPLVYHGNARVCTVYQFGQVSAWPLAAAGLTPAVAAGRRASVHVAEASQTLTLATHATVKLRHSTQQLGSRQHCMAHGVRILA
jgi:hypothetical protein